MELSKKERWFLSNQYRILEKLYPDNADHYARCARIVEAGYEPEYDSITEYICDPITSEACSEISDILAMYESLQLAYDDLKDREGIEEGKIKFQGFDGNSETDEIGYARFLINEQKKFQDLRRTENINSHRPSIGYYRRMLKEWKASSDEDNLTKADIVRITSIPLS